MIIGVTRADLKHCGKMPDAKEELNRSVREGGIEFTLKIFDERYLDAQEFNIRLNLF